MAFEVEPDVALGRRRKQPKAAVLLVREELDPPLARPREVQLERRLASETLEGFRPDARDLGRRRLR
jgi:hypothetical protein